MKNVWQLEKNKISFREAALDFFREINGLYELTKATLVCSFIEPLRGKSNRWAPIWKQMEEIGVRSLPLVLLVAFLIGVILSLQLSRLGTPDHLGSLMVAAVLGEIGPLLTALVLAGRVGAAFTAELGAMKTSDEILALEAMALNPVKILITPRFLAILVMLPCLTVMGDAMALLGGFMTGVTTLGIDPAVYLSVSSQSLGVADLVTGLIKSGAFAIIIVMVGSYLAFTIDGDAKQVGPNTRTAVVISMILILTADLLFNSFFYLLR